MKVRNILATSFCFLSTAGFCLLATNNQVFTIASAEETTYSITLSFWPYVKLEKSERVSEMYTANTQNDNLIEFVVVFDTSGSMYEIYNTTPLNNIRTLSYTPLTNRSHCYVYTGNVVKPSSGGDGVHAISTSYGRSKGKSYTDTLSKSYSDKYFHITVPDSISEGLSWYGETAFINSLEVTYSC